MPARPSWPSFTWDPAARQYRSANGRFVPRATVRDALDGAIDAAAVAIERDARLLVAGALDLPQWQRRTEANVKAIHVMSAAVAAGGWAQATEADWLAAARRIKAQYRYLGRFAAGIASGKVPLDGRVVARAISYATAGSGTYEAVLRRRDIASGRVLRERRLTHSKSPCGPCLGYAAIGWTEPGTLPDTGDACQCHSRCRCSFERQFV